MPFETNNEYWKLRSKDGRDKIYKTPAAFAEKANEYFNWCINHPLKEQVVHGKDSTIIELSRMRVFTLEGLCNFMDISKQCFYNYEKKNDYVAVTTRIREIIYNQKFEGASSGFFNSNIIARDLGLVEKKENENKHRGSITITRRIIGEKDGDE